MVREFPEIVDKLILEVFFPASPTDILYIYYIYIYIHLHIIIIFWATIETAVIEMAHSIPMKPCGSNDAPGKKVLKPSGCYWGLTVDVEEVDSIIMVCLHVFETKKQFYLHDKNTSTIN